MRRNLCFLIVALLSIAGVWSCGKDDAEAPDAGYTVEVTTKPVTEVTATTAVCGGEVTSDATPEITGRGVCWSTGTAPTVADAKTEDGTGLGTFRSSLNGLESGVTYYVRAYAVSAAGTVYGKAVSFTAGASTPVVTTAEVTEIGFKSAVGGGTLIDAGAEQVTDCGICWSKEENPTAEDANVTCDPTEGAFTLPIENLESGTTYYVRAFAVSAAGTGYGEQVHFTTREESLVTLQDENFMQYCLDNFDLDFDGKLQSSEAAEVKIIDCSDREIASLEGIGQFTALETLMANDNPIAAVDLSGNKTLVRIELIRTNLERLEIEDMPVLEALLCDALKEEQVGSMTSLSVKNCPVLKELFCQENSLTSLTLSGVPELNKICMARNSLASVDLSQCPKLAVLEAWDNPLTTLDVSANRELAELKITRNDLTSLEVADMPALTLIWCDGLRTVDGAEQLGALRNLSVRNCPSLTEIYCQENSIETLSLSECPALEKVGAWRNALTAFDLSNNTGIKTLQLAANRLVSVNLSGCSSLDLLDIPENQLTSLDLSGCGSLREIWMQNNRVLNSVDFSQASALQILRCMGCGILSLDLNGHTALTSAWCDGCGMESLNVNGCTALMELKCQSNNLSTLDVQGCAALGILWADSNSLTSLDLSGCGALTECNIQINRGLETLKVGGCTRLATLQAWDCSITSLDLSTCGALELVQLNDNKLSSLAVHGEKLHDVHCVRNQIASFTAENAPALTTIWIHDNLLRTLDVSQCAMQMNILGVCQPAEPEAHGNPLETLYVKNGQSFAEKYIPSTTQTIVK